MFVGTIHSYCFRILQQHVEGYETFDVLDDHKLTAFLTRELRAQHAGAGLGVLRSDQELLPNIQVVENELIDAFDLDDPFREIYEAYLGTLPDDRFLTTARSSRAQ
jgi:hypothetical protein